MANFQSDYARGLRPMPVAQGAEVVSVRMVVTPTAAATNDVFEFGELPENHVPVDWILDASDLDSNGSPTIALSVGVLNAAKTAVDTDAENGGAAWATGLTTAQTGGMVRPTTRATWLAIPRKSTPSGSTPEKGQLKMIGAVATAGAATFQAGTIALTLKYRAAHYGA